MKNKLFVFDVDGTLTDSVIKYITSVTRSLWSLGISDIDTDYNNYKHHTDSYALRYNYERNFDKNLPVGLLERFEKDLVLQMSKLDPIVEIKGARVLIDFLRSKEIPFCFATGGLPKPTWIKLDQCKIWYNELLLATSKTHESREGFVLEAIEKAKSFYGQTKFDQIISVGDGVWDLKTAKKLSLDFVGIGERHREKLIAEGVESWFTNLEDFKNAIF